MGQSLCDPECLLLSGVVQGHARKSSSEQSLRIRASSSVSNQEHRGHVGSVVAESAGRLSPTMGA